MPPAGMSEGVEVPAEIMWQPGLEAKSRLAGRAIARRARELGDVAAGRMGFGQQLDKIRDPPAVAFDRELFEHAPAVRAERVGRVVRRKTGEPVKADSRST